MVANENRRSLPVPAQESLDVPVLSFDVASAIMEANYRKGSDGSFISQVRSAMANPYEPATAKGLKVVHPVVLTIAFTALAAVGVFVYFTFNA